MSESNSTSIPVGYCQCGCDQKTTVYLGKPRRFINGHHGRKGIRYTVENRGYETPCWIWQGSITIHGYGHHVFRRNGKLHSTGAHRLVYAKCKGEIPEGLELDHLCAPYGGPRSCVNPDHLEPVTPAVNRQRGKSAKLTADDVVKVRRLKNDGLTQRAIAERLSVSPSLISRILSGERW